MPNPRSSFGISLVLVCLAALSLQSRAQSTSTAAHVYVQVGGSAGAVYGYSASSSGQLNPISGSPFSLGTEIIGSNGSQFFTLGNTLLHSFAVASNGAIQSQEAQIPIYSYAGSQCGDSQYSSTDSAVLDHTGNFIYVLLQNGPNNCAAYQTYQVTSSGDFNFIGDYVAATGINVAPVTGGVTLPSILGNEMYAYAEEYSGHNTSIIGFQRQNTGDLGPLQFTETDPTLGGYSSNYTPASPDASPTGSYMVLQLFPYDSGPAQLGSYTVDSHGNISTTNTSSDMPTAPGDYTTFSPSGDLLTNWGGAGQGITLYHFNGASALTLDTTLLSGKTIGQVAWDSSNHLYAISPSDNELYVFTVTPTSAVQDSATSIGSPVRLVVVSQIANTGGSCPVPSSGGINVCTPDENASVASPVAISAAASISGGIYRFSLWNGNTKLLTEDTGVMNGSVSLSPGTYHLIFDARNSAGVHEYAKRDITVTGGGSCTAPSSNGINVCTPAQGATVTSPVSINASATISGGIYRFSLWNGNTKLLSEDSGVMNSSISLAPGTYKLTFDARNTSGVHEYATRDVTVK